MMGTDYRPIHTAPNDADQHEQSTDYSTCSIQHVQSAKTSANQCQQTATEETHKCILAFSQNVCCHWMVSVVSTVNWPFDFIPT